MKTEKIDYLNSCVRFLDESEDCKTIVRQHVSKCKRTHECVVIAKRKNEHMLYATLHHDCEFDERFINALRYFAVIRMKAIENENIVIINVR